MTSTPTTIRDLRESKNLSEDKVAAACGLTYSRFVRIQAGEGKTTQEEIDDVLQVLKKMEPGTRKMAGRPFKDADKQAAVAAAREAGLSIAAAIAGGTARVPSPAPAKASAPAAAETAPASTEEAPAKPKRSRAKAAAPAAGKPARAPRKPK